MEKQYVAVDLKSFYASVECLERGLDPIQVNLVVADESRTEKTICLAVSPALKEFGIPGRPRLFEVIEKVKKINLERKKKAPGGRFRGKSCLTSELKDPSFSIDFLIAPPRMSLYLDYSTKIFQIYQEFISSEDIHVYSIDEVFLDVTNYLSAYHLSARELTARILKRIYAKTGITATAGIGTNLYLCKVAMDIVAKHELPDQNGVRIAQLNEESYKRTLWEHRPLTDFWRVGKGYSKKLEAHGIYTMGDVARCSLQHEDWLYHLFGVNAELLIDHAWGYEPCTIADIKAYQPKENSFGEGQVLPVPYSFEKGRLVLKEMADSLTLDLVEQNLCTNQLVLTVSYDAENLSDCEKRSLYEGEIVTDQYGREVPKHAHGTIGFKKFTSSSNFITKQAVMLYEKIVDRNLLIRKIYLVFGKVISRQQIPKSSIQLDLFHTAMETEEEFEATAREDKLQKTILEIHRKFGKNALVKGMSLEEGATAMQRNNTIGGHKK